MLLYSGQNQAVQRETHAIRHTKLTDSRSQLNTVRLTHNTPHAATAPH